MTPIDVARARTLTPGCEGAIHLDHAGSSLMSQAVLDRMLDHLRHEAAVGGYRAAADAEAAIDAAYTSVATLLACSTDEVALCDSATRGWSAAVYSLPISPGDRILTTRSEYGSNAIAMLQLQRRTGADVVVVDDDDSGAVDLAALAAALDGGPTAFVSLTHVPTQSGLVNPAAEVGRLCRAAGALFVLDASQSAGQLPIDVRELGCHVLAASGRKFLRGPRGTGFLYVERSLADRLEPVVLDMFSATWTDPDRYEVRAGTRRFELWESDIASRVGLGAAVDEALAWGIDAIAERTRLLAARLRELLQATPMVTVHDRGRRLCAITTFTLEGVPAHQVAARLRDLGATVAVSVATSAQLDLPHRGLDAVVRASVHYLTTHEELERFVALVRDLA